MTISDHTTNARHVNVVRRTARGRRGRCCRSPTAALIDKSEKKGVVLLISFLVARANVHRPETRLLRFPSICSIKSPNCGPRLIPNFGRNHIGHTTNARHLTLFDGRSGQKRCCCCCSSAVVHTRVLLSLLLLLLLSLLLRSPFLLLCQ